MIRPALLLSLTLLSLARGADWPITTDAAPPKWSVALDQNIAWKITLPETGQNTPLVHGGKVFFSTMKEVDADATLGSDIVAWCCDAANGKVLWQREIAGQYPQRLSGCFSDSTSPPAVCDGERVVFINASGTIACFDLNGAPLWSKKILSVGRTLPFVHDSRSEEHTSELKSRALISYAVFCLKKKIALIGLQLILQQQLHLS